MQPRPKRPAISLVELLAVLAILAFLSVMLVPRVAGHSTNAGLAACDLNRREIELQVQLWRRATGTFPAAALTDIGAQTTYFPEGLPICPVDGAAYTIDTATGLVTGHEH